MQTNEEIFIGILKFRLYIMLLRMHHVNVYNINANSEHFRVQHIYFIYDENC